MSVPCHHAPDDAIGARQQGLQAHIEECWVGRVDMSIPVIHPLAVLILHSHTAECRFKSAIKPDTGATGSDGHGRPHLRLAMVWERMPPGHTRRPTKQREAAHGDEPEEHAHPLTVTSERSD